MKINLKHDQSGALKNVKLGFSWTTLFFGGLVPLIRGDLKWFVIMWLIIIITVGVAMFIFPFIYNKIYIKGLLGRGYVPADYFSKTALQAKGIVI